MTTPTTVNVRLQLRADTAANWTAANPILLANEVGLETDTKKLKVGNGSTAWNSLAYFPSIVSGGTVLGNLEIGSTGTLTFEGSTADGFETTLAVTNPTADRTITLPNQSGTVVVSGNASIIDADIAANAEIAVSKLADGAARQLLQTDAAGTGVEWTSNVDIPGTLDVTGTATFDGAVTVAGDLTVNGTTTTISTQNLLVEDKNIILGDVATPTDTTADGGGITLKGATDKTINWVDSTDAWTSSEHINIASGKEYRIAGTSVLTSTTLGSGITSSSLTSVGTLGSLTVTGAITAGTFIPTSGTAPSNGLYLPAANSVALSTNSSERLRITSAGLVGIGTSSPVALLQTAGTVSVTGGSSASSANGLHLYYSTAENAAYIEAFHAGVDNRDLRIDGKTIGLGIAGSRKVTLTSTGLGIGTTSPGSPLHVKANSSEGIRIESPDFTGIYGLLTSRRSSGSPLDIAAVHSVGSLEPEISFSRSTNGSTFSESARIDKSGRLLVGTSSAFDGSTVIQAKAIASVAPGILDLQANFTSNIAGQNIGAIRFLSGDNAYRASIYCASDGDSSSSSDAPGRLVFSTCPDSGSSPVERMRIGSTGNIHLNNFTDTDVSNNITSAFIAATGRWIFCGKNADTVLDVNQTFDDTNARNAIRFYRNETEVGSISVSTSATSYNTSSDYRLKENVVAATDGITRLQQLKPSRFNFIADPAKTVDGFLAHEVQTIVPEAITGEKDAVDDDGNPVYQGIDQSKLVPLLTAALQEAVAKIESLEARLTAAGI